MLVCHIFVKCVDTSVTSAPTVKGLWTDGVKLNHNLVFYFQTVLSDIIETQSANHDRCLQLTV